MFTVLGPVSVTTAGVTRLLPRAQARAALGFLLLNVGRVVPAEHLVEALWGSAEPTTARNQVQALVSAIRRQLRELDLSDVLTSGPSGYRLALATNQLDLLMFEDSRQQAQILVNSRQLAAARDAMRSGLALWQGPALGGAVGSYVDNARLRLEDRRLSATEELIELELALGNYGTVVSEFLPMLDANPMRERLCRLLMTALYRAGRQVEALERYRVLRRELREEQGIDPGSELEELAQAILRGDVTLPGAATAVKQPLVMPGQLPADVAGFVGRDAELANLDALRQRKNNSRPTVVPVVAVVGTAGIGKTALAVHWAQRVRACYPDGQLFLNLRGYSVGHVVQPIEALTYFLRALGVPADQIPTDIEQASAMYRSLLVSKKVLIVLDNAATAAQVRPLLPGGAECFVLVTSRNQLAGMVARDGALVITLDLLDAGDAKQLLRELLGTSAVESCPDATVELAALCAYLPLALRIAAASLRRTPRMNLSTYNEQLKAGDRLSMLAVQQDDETAVRTTFDLSYYSLAAPARQIFRVLGLHPGPDISPSAAASLAGISVGEAQQQLFDLADAHLVTDHTPGRYTLHDLLRAYATELADAELNQDERQAAAHRILDHYLYTAWTADRLLEPHRDSIQLAPIHTGAVPDEITNQDEALDWFKAEHSVLIAAIQTAANAGFDLHAWQLAWSAATFLDRQGHWHDQASSQQIALEAAQRLNHPAGQGYSHRSLAGAFTWLGQLGEAHAHHQHALAKFHELGDQIGEAHTHINLSFVLHRQNQHAAALTHATKALNLYRELSSTIGQAIALNAIGWHHGQLGDYRKSVTHCLRAVELFRELNGAHGLAGALDSLGYAYHHLGNYQEAISCYRETLRIASKTGDRYYEAATWTHLGDSNLAAGSSGAARQAWQGALAIFDQLGHADSDSVRAKLRDLDHS